MLNAGARILSEFYQLRRTAIKDLAAYIGFLVGFIGSAPFAWGLLAGQLENGSFARGLWYFSGIVVAAGLFTGIAGLGVGFAVGVMWEQFHRYRRSERLKRNASLEPPIEETRADVSLPALLPQVGGPPRLQLMTSTAASFPDLSGRSLASLKFLPRATELDFNGVRVAVGGNPMIVSGAQRYRYPDPGSCDALCGLIGARVVRMRTAGDGIELVFDSGWELVIPRSSVAVA